MFKTFFTLGLFGLAAAKGAPKAPSLADSHWPVAHGDTWNSDVSTAAGPTSKNSSVFLLINGDTVKDIVDIFALADPITLVHSSVEGVTWGSSVSSVFQLRTDDSGISLINSYFRDMNFEYHGAYSLLGYDGTYFAAARTSIQAYDNEVPLDFSTPIIKKNEYFVEGLDSDEHIVGLTVTHDEPSDAFLIFATTKGKVGGVSLDFKKSTNLFQIAGLETVEMPEHFVSNSIGMDGANGGIYVVTSQSLNRLQWNPKEQTITSSWSTVYSSGFDSWFWGRLGPGSGTSPSLAGNNGIAEYAVITDGVNPMNIHYFDVKTGKIAGSHQVTFGSRGQNPNSTTDQSIVVNGYKAVVVNNWIADEVTPLCSEWFAKTNASIALKKECPYMFGAFVNGIEQFEIDPSTNIVRSVWANNQVSCTSSIPVLSEPTNTLFCLGKRKPLKGRATYTIEAVNWSTGKSLYYVELSPSLLANSLYAATEVGTRDDIVMGTLAGVVRVAQSTSAHVLQQNFHSLDSKSAQFWDVMDQLAEMSESGAVPSDEFLAKIGL